MSKIEIPTTLRDRAVAELVAKHHHDESFPRELIESELDFIIASAARMLGLVVGASQAMARAAHATLEEARSLLVEVADQVAFDGAEIGQSETLSFLRGYFSEEVSGELLNYLAGATRRSQN